MSSYVVVTVNPDMEAHAFGTKILGLPFGTKSAAKKVADLLEQRFPHKINGAVVLKIQNTERLLG